MSGYFVVARDAFDHPLLKDGDRFRAFFWLVAKACWKAARVDVGGRLIELERGQLCYSIRFLAEAWGWPKTTVERFLKRLEAESMLTLTRSKTGTASGTAQLIITVCNYDKYQRHDGESGTASGTKLGQQRDSSGTNKKKGKKGKKDSYESLSLPLGDEIEEVEAEEVEETPPDPAEPFPRPDWADATVWKDYLANRVKKKLANTETAHDVFLREIGKLVTDDWPPGRVLKEITAQGWGGVYPPPGHPKATRRNGNGNAQQPPRPTGYAAGLRAVARYENRDDPFG